MKEEKNIQIVAIIPQELEGCDPRHIPAAPRARLMDRSSVSGYCFARTRKCSVAWGKIARHGIEGFDADGRNTTALRARRGIEWMREP